jgi:hypothetical protein
LSNTGELLGMPLMPTMAPLGRLLTAWTVGRVGSASCMNMPYAVLVFHRFDLEARQMEGNRLDVIALLVTSTSLQSTHPSFPALAHKLRKNPKFGASSLRFLNPTVNLTEKSRYWRR